MKNFVLLHGYFVCTFSLIILHRFSELVLNAVSTLLHNFELLCHSFPPYWKGLDPELLAGASSGLPASSCCSNTHGLTLDQHTSRMLSGYSWLLRDSGVSPESKKRCCFVESAISDRFWNYCIGILAHDFSHFLDIFTHCRCNTTVFRDNTITQRITWFHPTCCRTWSFRFHAQV